jgi:hypothetical protein
LFIFCKTYRMIKIILILALSIVLWSCQKNDRLSSSKQLTSVSKYTKNQTGRVRETDSIIYDSKNRMTECRRMFYDTVINGSGMVTFIGFYQSNYVFSYSGSNILPSSYVITYSYSSNTSNHILKYNSLNQPIEDSDLAQHQMDQ